MTRCAAMLDLAANSREAAIVGLHAQLAKSPAVKDAPQFLHGLLERAMLAPVCIAPDVALPHARTTAVSVNRSCRRWLTASAISHLSHRIATSLPSERAVM